MSIIDKIFIGEVIKDFGVFDEKHLGLGKIKHSALLVEKYGRFYFVIKYSAWFLLSGSVSYEKFLLDDASKLRDYIIESETIAKNTPPIDYDISKLALRYSLITLIIASTLNLLIQESGVIIVTTIIATIFHGNQYIEFKNHPDVDSGTKKMLIAIPLITLLVAILKFFWLNFATWR